MPRNQGPSSDDPFYRRGQAGRSSYANDALPLDTVIGEDDDFDEQPQFRRAKRVPVRRGPLDRRTASRVRLVLLAVLLLSVVGGAVYEAREFALHSWRFRIRRAGDIELAGDASNSHAQVQDALHDLIGRNIFQISLSGRQQQLERIPWVESVSLVRLWPNHLRVVVHERTPVAFVALPERIELIDANGVLMDLPPGREYSFPVITGMDENEPLSTRAPRMKTYMQLVHELDGGTAGAARTQYSHNLDEVDLSDPEDVKVVVKGGDGPILLHLGSENFLPRFMVFLSNVQKWEQERGKLKSVDLRFGREVILNPDMQAPPPAAAPVAPAASAAPPKQAEADTTRHQPKKKRK